MNIYLANSKYFLDEVRRIFRSGKLPALSALFSIALMLFLLSLALSGWWTSAHVLDAVSAEAEINVFYGETIDPQALAARIRSLPGVLSARPVGGDEAYHRMAELLGDEAGVLGFFDENPFSPFIEVLIQPDDLNNVVAGIKALNEVEYVRDNRDILEKLHSIFGIIRFLGVLVMAAVGVSAVVVVSHIIRQGIEEHREQVHTLRLLGAPEGFVSLPFLLQGLLLALAGGLLALLVMAFALQFVYARLAGPLPFLPLFPAKTILFRLAATLVPFCALLGLGGSTLGLNLYRRSR